MKAVGWLSQNLGWNIAGRPNSTAADPTAVEGAIPTAASHSPTGTATNNGVAVIEGYLSHVSSVVFGSGGGAESAQGSNPFAAAVADCNSQQGARDVVENAELDEQGLPKTRNWYYYDDALGRWNVSSAAPQSVKDEFEERLRQDEIAKNKAIAFPEPPPPPPAFSAAALQPQRAPLTPQYAIPSYFNAKED